jgi:hypothetical protein
MQIIEFEANYIDITVGVDANTYYPVTIVVEIRCMDSMGTHIN